MYFAAGSARFISLADSDLDFVGKLTPDDYSTEDGAIIAIQETVDGNFFAALSIRAIYLWSTNPAAVISKIYRLKSDIDEFGENINLFWNVESTLLAVATSRNHVLLYRILALPSKIFQYEFSKPHHYNVGVAEGIGLYQASMMFKASIHIKSQVKRITLWENLIFISTRNQASIISVDATNLEKLHEEYTVLNKISGLNELDDSVYITEITVLEAHGSFLWLLSNGCLYLAKRNKLLGWGDHSKESISPLSFTWECFLLNYSSKIVLLDLNPRFSILAVGLLSGNHAIFTLLDSNIEKLNQLERPTKESEILPWAKLISEIPHRHNQTDKGEICCMAWSYDGQALALGFNNDGISVFSTFGTLLLLATRSSVQSEIIGPKQLLDEQYLNGVSYLFWGPASYSLCVLPSKAKFFVTSSVIYCIPFMRSIGATNQVPDNFAHSLLIGSELILILSESPLENNQRPMRHKYIHLPNSYMAENWPVDLVAISPLGRYVAVSGLQGFSLYCRNAAVWKLFGNRFQESSFTCKGLLFINEWLVVLAQLDSGEYKIWVFDCERNLDLSLAYGSISLTEKPVLMTKIFGSIYLLMESKTIAQLRLHLAENEALKIFIDKTWELPSSISSNKITCLTRTSSLIPTFIFLYSGDLYLFTPEPQQLIILDTQVECIFSTEVLHADLGESVWLLSRGECHITSLLRERIFVPLDFTPLSLSSKKGYLLGLSPHYTLKKGFEILTYSFNSKTCLYLHHVLEFFLSRKMTQAAHEFSANFSHLGYFSHALEMLLHCVWEREAETQAIVGTAALLPEVVAFIKQFDQFLDIIVNCARKTELTLWDYLFSFIDSPQVLFDKCLEKNQLHTATSFLVIVHNMGPHRLSGKESIRLLEKLLQNENFELSRDLIRFLRSIDGKGASLKLWESLNRNKVIESNSLLNETDFSNVTSNSSLDVANGADTVSYFELLVRRHACHLISSFRIRSLLSMFRSLDFPLSLWLSKERFRHAKLEDHFEALKHMHSQFDWPYPLTIPTLRSSSDSLHILSRRHSVATVEIEGESPPLNPIRGRRALSFIETGFSDLLRNRLDAVHDLKLLAKITLESECYGWAFLLAAMLGDAEAVIQTVNTPEQLEEWKLTESALLQTEAPGYKLWADLVNNKIQSAFPSFPTSSI
ncbi:hypothetical protein HMI54_015749 [Coelomomyces lativittatus]|nr:hypothetical protein HMI54_015749 [Coelomomyces lativittatus]